jgi:AhpC/TSA family
MQPLAKIAMLWVVLPIALLCCRQGERPSVLASQSIVLQDARGSEHRFPTHEQEVKATVAIFLMTDCPVANAMIPDLNEMSARFAPLGIRFFGVFSEEKQEDILRHSEDYRIPFPCVLDDSGMKPEPAERNLADALEALVAGQNLPAPQPATAGCFIPKRDNQETKQPNPR